MQPTVECTLRTLLDCPMDQLGQHLFWLVILGMIGFSWWYGSDE